MFPHDPLWKRILGYLFVLPAPLAIIAGAISAMMDTTMIDALTVVMICLLVAIGCSGVILVGVALLNADPISSQKRRG